jgi:hypothetical protein
MVLIKASSQCTIDNAVRYFLFIAIAELAFHSLQRCPKIFGFVASSGIGHRVVTAQKGMQQRESERTQLVVASVEVCQQTEIESFITLSRWCIGVTWPYSMSHDCGYNEMPATHR